MTTWEFLSNSENVNTEEWISLIRQRDVLIKTYGRKSDIVQQFYDKERR